MNKKVTLIAFALAVLLSVPVAVVYAYLSKSENPPLTVEFYAKGSFDQQNVFVHDPRLATTLYMVRWTAPKEMRTNQHVIVKADVYAAPAVASKIDDHNVHVEAELLGEGFTITNRTPGDQKGRGKVSLRWEVIPKKEGEFPLEFELKTGVMKIKNSSYDPDLHQKDASYCSINVVTPFHFVEDAGKIAGLISVICQWPFWAFVFLRKDARKKGAETRDQAKSATA